MITGRELVDHLFSDYEGDFEERLYSTGNDELDELLERAFCDGYEYAQREFGNKDRKDRDDDKKRKRTSLSTVEDHTGLKRAIITSPFTGGGSLVGGYLSKSAADEADAAGDSDEEILRKAKKAGMKYGAITGAATGGSAGLALGPGGAILSALGHAGMGAIGGSEAARVNTKARLEKRRIKDLERRNH